jgi:hypothetical protein
MSDLPSLAGMTPEEKFIFLHTHLGSVFDKLAEGNISFETLRSEIRQAKLDSGDERDRLEAALLDRISKVEASAGAAASAAAAAMTAAGAASQPKPKQTNWLAIIAFTCGVLGGGISIVWQASRIAQSGEQVGDIQRRLGQLELDEQIRKALKRAAEERRTP